jgi:probable phosphoglycerate mutase
MKTKFIMVRHATCAHIDDTLLGRTLDAPLDANGERQAGMLAERLRDEAPLSVESSPRRRTLQTARAIADEVRCDVQVATALDELDFGEWSGRSFEQLQREDGWRRWNRDRDDARTPAGIDIQAVQRSIALHLAALAATFAGATLVLVTHAEVIRSLVLHCLHAPARDYARFAVDPASITCFTSDAGGLHVGTVNEVVAP